MLYFHKLFSPGPKEGTGAPIKSDDFNEDGARVDADETDDLNEEENLEDFDESEELDDLENPEEQDEESDTIL